MLHPCSVNKLRTSMRSCGSRFPQRKTSFFKSFPSALQGQFILVKHPLGNLKKYAEVTWHWLCKCLQPQTRCAVSAESLSLLSRRADAPVLPAAPCPMALALCRLCVEVLGNWQFPGICKNLKFKGKIVEQSCCHQVLCHQQLLCDGTDTLWCWDDGKFPASSAELNTSQSDT